ncbi:Fructose-1,6-bisphosphatase class 2 [Planctopirus ephydatiae]|jgi:fructose-1,6-bisphosphatase II|uniref:Fructose-1,6-bisphosphatase n=1 Tax=Planctopirus ephydatiae TaxID=2528019 RepID=A0A518GPD4_9PLAN|nr:fructose-bisphosphatase class II family protein [Planctopirus ephydatiae]QDV30482.1 Fructose-1,6-bisphosphatase class 2 [Planctopirus ephydatiae]
MTDDRRYQSDFERQIEFDFLRATEIAALNTLQWLGKGQKEKADEAACDAIRGMFDLMDIRGEVVLGEGIKDEAPGLFKGERVGTWKDGSPRFEIALDPVDGTTNVSKGMPNSLSCIAAAAPTENGEPCLSDIPAFYMKKLAYPLKVRRAWLQDPSLPIHVDAPISDVIDVTARILGKDVRDVVVCVLDRPRNENLIEAVRRKGAALRMIMDGDIAAALAPAMHTSNIDLYAGIGGTPEAILAAAGLRCLGGGMRAKIWPRDDAERQSLIAAGWGDRLDKEYMSRDLARGDNLVFTATGISDSPLLPGVKVRGSTAITHSVIMRARSGTVRFIESHHDLERKTIHLRSTGVEREI